MTDVTLNSLIMPLAVFVISLGSTSLVRRYSRSMRLVSVPNHRSSHVQPTPSGGGLGIVLGGTVAGAWLSSGEGWQWWTVSGLALTLAIIGLVDDIRPVPAHVRFAVQLFVVSILLYTVTTIADQGDVKFASGQDIGISALTVLIVGFAGVWWINLFNFMDGIDAIAGSQATYMLLAAVVLGAQNHAGITTTVAWWWMLGLTMATAGFLILNWPPARIFMGDVGSTYLAFLIFALALVSICQGWHKPETWLILGAAFISDATVTLVRRAMTVERWFEAHRSHAYQHLARRLGSHRPVTLLTIAINLIWLLPLALLSMRQPNWSWLVVLIAYIPLIAGAWKIGAGKNNA